MANEIYQVQGTALTWKTSGGDEALDLGGTGGDSGDILAGSYYDRGDLTTTPAPDTYIWHLFCDGLDTAGVVSETIDLYFAQSDDSTTWDGEITALNDSTETDLTALGTDILRNLMFAGSAVIHSTTAADEFSGRGIVRITSRYFAPVVHNNTADKLLSTADAHVLTLIPTYYQSQ